MRTRGGRGLMPVLGGAVTALGALVLAAGLLGFLPGPGAARLGALPQPTPVWAARLGLADHIAGTSPNLLVEDRLAMLGDTPGAAALREALCIGSGFDADPAFRKARAVLVRNNGRLCPSLGDRVQARAPLIVVLGPGLGWPLTLAAAGLLAAVATWRGLRVMRAYDRWRLLDRSTFGAARGAGTG